MKPVPLTPEEKEHKKRRDFLKGLTNRIASAWSFGKIHTWNDVYAFSGTPDGCTNSSDKLTYPELKTYFTKLNEELEKNILGGGQEQAKPILQQSTTSTNGSELVVHGTKIPAQETSKDDGQISEQETTGYNEKNNYGLIPSPNEDCNFYWNQKIAISQAMQKIGAGYKSLLALGGTGVGKTYVLGGIIRRLVDTKYHEGKTFGPIKYLYITKASIVEQTKRVLESTFKLTIKDGVEVLNIEQLRSKAGQLWVEDKTIIENGVDRIVWIWKPYLNPVVIIWDESQGVMNEDSTQAQIACSFSEVQTPTLQIFASASPFVRVSGAKCFAVATKKDISSRVGIGNGMRLTAETWPTYASFIAQGDPYEYNETACERLRKDLDQYIVSIKSGRWQFNAKNRIEMIEFESKEQRQEYEDAYNKYLIEKAKIDAARAAAGLEVTGGGLALLVEFLKFRMAAEKLRSKFLAKEMWKIVNEKNKAAACALGFKGTIIDMVTYMVKELGISRDNISLIWGGGQTQLTKKQKDKNTIMENADRLKAMGVDIEQTLKALDLVDVDERKLEQLDPALRLGPQSKEERQREIDRYQAGKTLYMIFTLKSGGVGLSLQHTDKLTKIKARRKKNGYVVVEDIPLVPTRERELLGTPTYSAIEMVQMLGRLPRIDSMSDSVQRLIFFKDTIEESVAAITSTKLRCLGRFTRMREAWNDIVMGGVDPKSHMDISNVPEEDSGISSNTIDEDESEDE